MKRRITIALAALVVIFGIVIAASYTADLWPNDPPTDSIAGATGAPSSWEKRLERVATAGILVGGAMALGIATWRGFAADQQARAAKEQGDTALKQSNASQRRLLDERYQQGAAMLTSPLLAVRIAGVYALERLVEDDKQRYYADVMNVFAAFVREAAAGENEEDTRTLRADVQAAIGGIARRNDPLNPERVPQGAKENQSHLLHEQGVVNLMDANLRYAWVLHGSMRRVILMRSDLTCSKFWWANLSNAFLLSAILADASILECDLTDAMLLGADLTGASLCGSILAGVDLRSANLPGVEFSDDGDFPVTGLTQKQLDEAKANPYDPPKLKGVLDSETDKPLVWRGIPWFG